VQQGQASVNQKSVEGKRVAMTLQQKIASFAILEGGWIVWLLLGFSMGGVALLLQRAVILLADRSLTWRRKAGQRGRDAGPADVVQLSRSGFAQC
jgi:hypothetical protein